MATAKARKRGEEKNPAKARESCIECRHSEPFRGETNAGGAGFGRLGRRGERKAWRESLVRKSEICLFGVNPFFQTRVAEKKPRESARTQNFQEVLRVVGTADFCVWPRRTFFQWRALSSSARRGSGGPRRPGKRSGESAPWGAGGRSGCHRSHWPPRSLGLRPRLGRSLGLQGGTMRLILEF